MYQVLKKLNMIKMLMCTFNPVHGWTGQPVKPGMGKKDTDTWDRNFPTRESYIC